MGKFASHTSLISTERGCCLVVWFWVFERKANSLVNFYTSSSSVRSVTHVLPRSLTPHCKREVPSALQALLPFTRRCQSLSSLSVTKNPPEKKAEEGFYLINRRNSRQPIFSPSLLFLLISEQERFLEKLLKEDVPNCLHFRFFLFVDSSQFRDITRSYHLQYNFFPACVKRPRLLFVYTQLATI